MCRVWRAPTAVREGRAYRWCEVLKKGDSKRVGTGKSKSKSKSESESENKDKEW
jgi:hypothetical protein